MKYKFYFGRGSYAEITKEQYLNKIYEALETNTRIFIFYNSYLNYYELEIGNK